jgi:hypothetical protein
MSADKFLSRLQWEYFECLVKKSIHTRRQNEIFWEKVAKKKANKIKQIGASKELQTIFDSSALYNIYKKQIFPSPESKLPKVKLTKEEVKLLFGPGRSVTVWVEEEEKKGLILERYLNLNTLKVQITGIVEPKIVSILNVMVNL